MKSMMNDLFSYARGIARKWVLWIFAALDIVALIAQFLYPSFHLPQLLFLLVIVVGFFWAGFQVYHDTVAQPPSLPIEHPPYELLPLSFRIEFRQEIPQIEIWLYVVNYQSREIVLQNLEIKEFHLSGGPFLANIPMYDEIRLPARQSSQVLCRRSLIDPELRALEKTNFTSPIIATLVASSRSLLGRNKQLHYKTPSLSLDGWILRNQNTS